MDDLSKYLPFMRSVSVVPAGITKYRDNLYPLELFTKEEAGEIIDMIESRQKKYYEEYGLHFMHASDEWYITAGRDFPEEERYDGYIQLENGVGMVRLLKEEVDAYLKKLPGDDRKRRVTIATGELAAPYLREHVASIRGKYPNVEVQVITVKNEFFGGKITVAGLLTGQDLVKQLKGKDLGEELLLSINMLKSDEPIFLDDMTVEQLQTALQIKVSIVESSGNDFVNCILNE